MWRLLLLVPSIALAQNTPFGGTDPVAGLSGTNTGDVTLGAFGATPAAEGASLSGQVLTLQPADATHAGHVSVSAQTWAGAKTFTSSIIGTAANNFCFDGACAWKVIKSGNDLQLITSGNNPLVISNGTGAIQNPYAFENTHAYSTSAAEWVGDNYFYAQSGISAANATATVPAFRLQATVALDANDLLFGIQKADGTNMFTVDLEGDTVTGGALNIGGNAIVGGTDLQLSSNFSNIWFTSTAATSGRIFGNTSAANATATVASLKLTTNAALDANDALVSFQNVGGTNVAVIDYEGDAAFGSVQIGSSIATGLKVPTVHGTATAQQAIESGKAAMTAGSLAVTFGTAFGVAPSCTCAVEAALACTISVAANTTGITFAATAGGTNVVDWICIGQQ